MTADIKQRPARKEALAISIDPVEIPSEVQEQQMGAYTIEVPVHVQSSLDAVLDFYAQTGSKPEIKLCGNPLDIVSDFITKIQSTLPDHIVNQGKDVMDFIIQNLCDFCRARAMNHMTLQFVFDRGGFGEA